MKKPIRIAGAMFCICLLAAQVALAEAAIKLVGHPTADISRGVITTERSQALKVIAVGQPVYAKSVYEGTYSWSLTAPDGSSAVLSSTTDQEIHFIVDMKGEFVLTLSYTDSDGAASETSITIDGATYIGQGTVGGQSASYPQCGICHSSENAGWKETGHASIFANDIDGITSSHVSESCNPCHTTGYTGTDNGGFDDRALAAGWTYPEVLQPGNWETLTVSTPEVAVMANVQCEACHGPGSEHGGSGQIDYSFNAGVCAYCHDAPTHHTQATEWNVSSHGIEADPEEHFNREGPDCVGCHTAEGFFELNVSDAHETTAPYDVMNGITCAICHDPHDASGEHMLRTSVDYNSMTEEGEAVYYADGTAAKACDVCHHLRPGTDVPGSSPHYSHQSDVLSNAAGYQYEGGDYPASNPHNDINENRCANCHMYGINEGDALDYDKSLLVGKHTFHMSAENEETGEEVHLTEACAKCHPGIGENFDYKGVQSLVEEMLDRILAALPVYTEENAPSSRYIGRVIYSQADFEAGLITESQMRAAYNWNIFHYDGSHGIHNPGLIISTLAATMADLGLEPIMSSNCDFNEDGKINISDVISLLIYQRNNPTDSKGDYNGDGKINIADAISMLIDQRDGKCSSGLVSLASVSSDDYIDVALISGLSEADVSYVESILGQLNLTAEEEAAFRTALYGAAGASSLPKSFSLAQNSPNPFNPATTISFSIPEGQSARVVLNVYDIRGKLVRNLVNETRESGTYTVYWNGTDNNGSSIASGVYFYRMNAGEFSQTRKMVMLK